MPKKYLPETVHAARALNITPNLLTALTELHRYATQLTAKAIQEKTCIPNEYKLCTYDEVVGDVGIYEYTVFLANIVLYLLSAKLDVDTRKGTVLDIRCSTKHGNSIFDKFPLIPVYANYERAVDTFEDIFTFNINENVLEQLYNHIHRVTRTEINDSRHVHKPSKAFAKLVDWGCRIKIETFNGYEVGIWFSHPTYGHQTFQLDTSQYEGFRIKFREKQVKHDTDYANLVKHAWKVKDIEDFQTRFLDDEVYYFHCDWVVPTNDIPTCGQKFKFYKCNEHLSFVDDSMECPTCGYTASLITPEEYKDNETESVPASTPPDEEKPKQTTYTANTKLRISHSFNAFVHEYVPNWQELTQEEIEEALGSATRNVGESDATYKWEKVSSETPKSTYNKRLEEVLGDQKPEGDETLSTLAEQLRDIVVGSHTYSSPNECLEHVATITAEINAKLTNLDAHVIVAVYRNHVQTISTHFDKDLATKFLDLYKTAVDTKDWDALNNADISTTDLLFFNLLKLTIE